MREGGSGVLDGSVCEGCAVRGSGDQDLTGRILSSSLRSCPLSASMQPRASGMLLRPVRPVRLETISRLAYEGWLVTVVLNRVERPASTQTGQPQGFGGV